MLGPLLAAGASLAGGLLGRESAKDANETRVALANQEYERQKEFAQMGIQWKVKDAVAAGIHPLFAMGASTSGYAPQSIGVDKDGLGSAVAFMGQDLSRAAAAGSTQAVRQEVVARDALVLEGLSLDNDIKRASLASAVQKLAAPATGIPIPEKSKADERPQGWVSGHKWGTDPNTSNVEDFWEKRYGEPGEWVGGALVGSRDIAHNLGRDWERAKLMDRFHNNATVQWLRSMSRR